MATLLLENPVLFGMRLGAELDQIRQSAMQQALAQSLATAREQLQFAWGMLADSLRYTANLPEQQKAAWEPVLRSLARALMPPSGPGVFRGTTYVPYLRPAGIGPTTLGSIIQQSGEVRSTISDVVVPTEAGTETGASESVGGGNTGGVEGSGTQETASNVVVSTEAGGGSGASGGSGGGGTGVLEEGRVLWGRSLPMVPMEPLANQWGSVAIEPPRLPQEYPIEEPKSEYLEYIGLTPWEIARRLRERRLQKR